MMDGRNFSKWQPGAAVNEEIRSTNNIKSNWQYRQYLTENADSIIKSNQIDSCDSCGYCSASNVGEPIQNSPYLYTSCMDKSQPYGYEGSNLKNIYLSSQQLQSRMMAPVLSQEQYLQKGYFNPN